MPLSDKTQSIFDKLTPEERELMLAEVERLGDLQQHEPTPSDQWKSPRKAGFVIELPSGNFARVKRTMSMIELIKNGKIPNPLGAVVNEMIEKGELALNLAKLDMEARMQAIDLVDQTVVNAMVEPRVIIPPENVNPEIFQAPPGAISINDLTFEDRLFISEVAQGGATDLTRFRTAQNELMERLRNGAGVPLPAERVDRPKRSSSSSKRKR